MRIYPAVHYTMGGLWVDYNLQSSIPGLFVGGEANFSDHGANRLGASALMQGLADGYFVLPYTVNDYLAGLGLKDRVDNTGAAFKDAEREVTARTEKLLANDGDLTVDELWKRLGKIMWNECGMARSRESLTRALHQIPALREEFHRRVKVLPGSGAEVNQELEKAGRVADFMELAELLCFDALDREESCGGHFRTEYQTPDGEAKRNDEKYAYVAAWEWKGVGVTPALNKEPLAYENIQLATRSYK
jgi:succinate dehydrogenase / fumarate reductase flavoprotein subunit